MLHQTWVAENILGPGGTKTIVNATFVLPLVCET